MRPVLIPDLADGAMSRWPVYAPAVHAEGVRAVFAFPLQVGAARLGVMDVFRTRAGMLSPDELTLALTFAEVAVATLLDGHDSGGAGVADGWLDDPLGSRAELFQAQGMVMVQLRVSLAEAMVRMRAHAYVHDRRLYDVAADVVARRLSFDAPQP
ncbi:ANTAR domain-containing protein [Catellatospora vulcania]|uniref:ANTAR domain-containing protein n=1 Tax=Catellatospora vulcania TaxID=1460450 RepID=UPI001E4EEEC3|nr:ANTAR domain-containing protein [Catellatospora vulcania]